MNTAQVISLQHAVVLRGQRAWGRIKATAAEQRQLWREVGEALEVGKAMNQRSYMGQKFSEWVEEKFPGLGKHDCADSMWLAEFCDRHKNLEVPEGLTHPSRIRRWFNEQQAADVAPEVRSEAPEAAAEDLEALAKVARIARKWNAVTAHANGTGPEAVPGQRQRRAMAQKEGLTEEFIDAKVGKFEPLSKVSPDARPILESAITAINRHADTLAAAINAFPALSREFVIHQLNQQLILKGL